MPPYYAALLASARGDAEGTVRHVLVLKSRWEDVIRRAGTDAPEWFRQGAKGHPVGAAIAARIESARNLLAKKDVAGAHQELEAVRAILRDARAAGGARTLDDAVTDYHESMERLASHVGSSNEVTLAPADFILIREDVRRTRAAWVDVESFRDFPEPSVSHDVAAATTRLLNTIGAASERSDAAVAQRGAVDLKNRYFDLLTLLSRQRY